MGLQAGRGRGAHRKDAERPGVSGALRGGVWVVSLQEFNQDTDKDTIPARDRIFVTGKLWPAVLEVRCRER